MTPTQAAPANLDVWTDLSGFGRLRAQARGDAGATLPQVARQFESVFTQMMLKSMRQANASLGEDPMGSQAGDAWRDMFDQQLSLSLSQAGGGLGIAQMLVRQLGGGLSGAVAGAGDDSVGATAGTTNPAQAGLPATPDEFRQRLSELVEAGRDVGRSVSRWLPQNAQEFVHTLAPYAQAAAKKLGVSVRTVLAQAALETQWGKHMPRSPNGDSSFNLFGIKAGQSWDGKRVSVPTLEYEDGVAVRRHAQFRAYDSPAESFADFARLIEHNPNYAGVRGQGDDVHGYARALVEGGYATDPAYAAKIAAVADSPTMREALASLKNASGLPND
jgi:flagellar protein FlgJ